MQVAAGLEPCRQLGYQWRLDQTALVVLLFVPGVWEKYVDAKSVVTAASQAAEKVADNGSEQVWQMTITLSSPLPGSNKTQDTAYVILAKTESGWKFDRFLMEEEINAILARGKTPTTTVEEGKK